MESSEGILVKFVIGLALALAVVALVGQVQIQSLRADVAELQRLQRTASAPPETSGDAGLRAADLQPLIDVVAETKREGQEVRDCVDDLLDGNDPNSQFSACRKVDAALD